MTVARSVARAVASPVARAVGAGVGAAFDPSQIFVATEGAWIDPSDLSTMFQDTGQTTAVAADGDPVRVILDKSGNGNHYQAGSDALRPTYKTSGGKHWLEFGGTQYMDCVNAVTSSGAFLWVMGAGYAGGALSGYSLSSSAMYVFYDLTSYASARGALGTSKTLLLPLPYPLSQSSVFGLMRNTDLSYTSHQSQASSDPERGTGTGMDNDFYHRRLFARGTVAATGRCYGWIWANKYNATQYEQARNWMLERTV